MCFLHGLEENIICGKEEQGFQKNPAWYWNNHKPEEKWSGKTGEKGRKIVKILVIL